MMRHAVRTGILAIVVLAVPAQAEDKTTQRTWDAGGRAAPALMAKMTPQRVTEGDAWAWARQPIPAQGRPVAVQTATVPPPPPRAIREAQKLLAGLGYEPGPVDGVWNETTVQAYQKFLRDAGLPAAETLTPDTLRALAKFRGGGQGRGEAARPSAKAAPPDALHRAAKLGNLDGLKAALAAGADVNARDDRGWTPLMHAANRGYTLLIEPLLAAKADLDVRGKAGATALFIAVANRRTEIITLLVKAGADVSIKGPKGKTAVDVAQMSGDAAIISALGLFQVGEMVSIPGGSFRMGCTREPPEAYRTEDRCDGLYRSNEMPVHEVQVGAFEIGQHEVTQEVWAAVMGENPSYFKNCAQCPVERVSWDDIQVFLKRLNEQTGAQYRLPTEAEWEYAARGGQESRGYWYAGSDDLGAVAWYGENNGEKTHPVGQKEPNELGLYDMSGNVAEWVQDCWHDDYDGAPSDGRAWELENSGDCSRRVYRGMYSNSYLKVHLSSAFRMMDTSGDRSVYRGFRLARTLTP